MPWIAHPFSYDRVAKAKKWNINAIPTLVVVDRLNDAPVNLNGRLEMFQKDKTPLEILESWCDQES